MMTTIPQAYIAGSYTAEHPSEVIRNIRAALFGALKASSRGYLPIVPHSMGPHHGVTWEEAMIRCRYLIRKLETHRGDVLVMLPGWENSRGAREEVGLAVNLGIRVVKLVDL